LLKYTLLQTAFSAILPTGLVDVDVVTSAVNGVIFLPHSRNK